MNPKLTSFLRHVFTGWIAAAVLAMTGWFALDDAQIKDVTSALDQIGAGVLLLIVTVGPIVGRMAWAWLASLFRRGAGELESGKSGGSGGISPILLVGTGAVLMGVALPSCSSPVPVQIGIAGPGFAGSYSAKGLNIQAVLPTK